MPASFADALARIFEGRYPLRGHPAHRRRLIRLESGLRLDLAPAAVLGELVARCAVETLGAELYRHGRTPLTRPAGTTAPPEPADVADLAATLGATLGALPARRDAGRFYGDARLLGEAPADFRREYLADVTRAAVRHAPEWRPPREETPDDGPRLTPAGMKAAARERGIPDEVTAARWWIFHALQEGTITPGTMIPAADMYRDAAADLSNVLEEYREGIAEGYGAEPLEDDRGEEVGPPRPPHRPTVFHRAAARTPLGAPVTGRNGVLGYIVPRPPSVEALAAQRARAVEEYARRAPEREALARGDRRAALLAQRARHAATPSGPSAPPAGESRTDRHAREARASVASWLPRELANKGPGRYALGELWAAWQAYTAQHWRYLLERDHGARTLGRSRFFAIVRELTPELGARITRPGGRESLVTAPAPAPTA